ncbi:MAG: phage/plasmid primase, P4 family [Candidatus Eisenbacteria bacterium]|nr:phage/plasmid primase, P4 family [Candidatus Eisenbacteria bacterium]
MTTDKTVVRAPLLSQDPTADPRARLIEAPAIPIPAEDAPSEVWARYYTQALGWALTPIPRGVKGPIGVGWNQPRSQANPTGFVTDPDQAERVWRNDQNMGVVLGPSRLVSLDVDYTEGARVAFAAVGLDLEALLTLSIRIEGNPARAKILFRLPDGVELPTRKLTWPPKRAGEKAVPIVELRAGPLQDVLPPSGHPSTKRPYRWLRAPWDAAITEPPSELLALWRDWTTHHRTLLRACPWNPNGDTLPGDISAAARGFRGEQGDVVSELRKVVGLEPLLRDLGAKPSGGRRWLCPFHPDGSPSFWIYEAPDGTRLWVDGHGSGPVGVENAKGQTVGDVIDLYRFRHSVGFTEAVSALAREAGLSQPMVASGASRNGTSGRQPSSPTGPDRFRLTDYGNAERLVSRHGEDLRYCHPAKHWYAWDGRRWRFDDTGEVERRAKESVRSIYAELANVTDMEEAKALFKHSQSSEREPRIRAAIDLAKSEPGIYVLPADLDKDALLLNIENGTLDLRLPSGGPLRLHSREDLLTCLAPVAFDPIAECPTFIKFINYAMGQDQELVAYLQRVIGYCLTGSDVEQALFIFYGLGENGKSTLLRLLLYLMGDYAMQAPPDLLLVQRKDCHPTGVADLKGKRLVTGIETEAGAHLAEALVKQLTGGDKIRARRLYQNYFEFDPTHKVILAVNHRPVVRGSDHAIWRRIHLIPFTVKVAPEDKDPGLLAKLKEEAPGILRWALAGCAEWQDIGGLAPPAAVLAATDDYRREMDALGGFIDEMCVIDPKVRVLATALYQTYAKTCRDAREEPVSQTEFGTQLTERGFASERKGGKVWRIGLGLGANDGEGDT